MFYVAGPVACLLVVDYRTRFADNVKAGKFTICGREFVADETVSPGHYPVAD
jgi:hypothetical protein